MGVLIVYLDGVVCKLTEIGSTREKGELFLFDVLWMVLVAIYAKQDSVWLVNGNKDKEGAVRDNKGGQRKMFGRRWRLRDCECCSSRTTPSPSNFKSGFHKPPTNKVMAQEIYIYKIQCVG